MAIKKGLGRGFDALIPTQLVDEAFDPTAAEDTAVSRLKEVPHAAVEPDPEQPRRHFDEAALAELAASIKTHGVMQPLVVTQHGSGLYRLIAGERRWRASALAGLATVPVIVRTVTAQQRLELALIENLQRENLNPLEEATAYLKLHQQFNMKYDEIGLRVGKALSTVSNILRLLNLPEPAKDALVRGAISEGHARQILALEDPKLQQQLLELITTHGWSVRKAEQFVVAIREGAKSQAGAVKKTQSETRQTKQLSRRLGAPVQVKAMAKGGQLIIRYASDDELERIYGQLL
ncbi:ParB/RepB/Spo0J family partition protein [Candidatus Saccharibacteria bacterium]|nr:ParB/RepB/Spo0J family partition protein [Candidatus Saccharibacteria bacterium]